MEKRVQRVKVAWRSIGNREEQKVKVGGRSRKQRGTVD